jgi:hypothetical protein
MDQAQPAAGVTRFDGQGNVGLSLGIKKMEFIISSNGDGAEHAFITNS